jgi:hypothetical protein
MCGVGVILANEKDTTSIANLSIQFYGILVLTLADFHKNFV